MADISFWGSPFISAQLLEKLIADSRFNVRFVVSQKDKPRSHRGREVMPSPVKKVALEAGIPVFTPAKIKKESAELLSAWQEFPVDFHVILAYGKIIPEKLFAYPRLRAVNFHASLLPKLRGAAPIEFSLLEGFSQTGFTLQQITAELDAGDVYFTGACPIDWAETRDSLYAKLTEILLGPGVDALADYAAGKLSAKPQNHNEATFCSKISTQMGEVDWQKDAMVIRRQAQALAERPGIYSFFRQKKIKLFLDFHIPLKTIEGFSNSKPGEFCQIDENLFVGCGNGHALPFKEIQIEGKKRMPIADFVNGYGVKVGDALASN